jgi:hypothetical protein
VAIKSKKKKLNEEPISEGYDKAVRAEGDDDPFK